MGLLSVSSASYLCVLALMIPAFVMVGRRQAYRLNMAVAFLLFQGTTSGGVALTVFWSLLIADYTESVPAVNPSP